MTYDHKVNADGSSTLEQIMDLTQYLEYIKNAPSGSLGVGQQAPDVSQLSKFCELLQAQLTQGTSCKMEDNKLSLIRSFTLQDKAYTFQSSSSGLFSSKYKVTVNKINTKAFLNPPSENKQVGSLGTIGSPEDIDFTAKEKNSQLLEGIRTLKMNMSYVVHMPGAVTKATAGKYHAIITGDTATFDLVNVFEDSEPLVIEAESGGTTLIIVSVIGILIIFILFYFLVSSKQPKKAKGK